MVKNKIISIALACALVVGGSGMAIAGTLKNSPASLDDALPISAPVTETKFRDIQGHWAFHEITLLESKGFWKDLTDEFEPNKAITREELYLYLDKLFDFEEALDFEFIPEQDITRIQAAKAIQNSFRVKNLAVMMTLMFPLFEDTTDLQDGGNDALSFVFNTSIMRGRTAEKFFPDAPITRAEFAVVLYRTIPVLEIAEPIEESDYEYGNAKSEDNIENNIIDKR